MRVTLLRGIVAAERALGGALGAGPVPDIISRATQAFKRAKEALDAPGNAARAAGRTAANAIKDAVLGAVEKDRAALLALGQGAKELVADVQAFAFGPLVVFGFLYFLTR